MEYDRNMYIMMIQKQEHQRAMTSIRVSDKFRARLGKIRARITLEEGKELSMEELLELMADAFEEKRRKIKE
jgi:hypothetical protein